jgi:hypothetical protein
VLNRRRPVAVEVRRELDRAAARLGLPTISGPRGDRRERRPVAVVATLR